MAHVEILRDTLATLFVASVHTRKCHWNVQGPCFGPLHELFGKQYDAMDRSIDVVAERIRSLDASPMTSDIANLVRLSEVPDVAPKSYDCDSVLRFVLQENETIITCLEEYIEDLEKEGDCASAQILTDLLIHHSQQRYLLRSHLEPKAAK